MTTARCLAPLPLLLIGLAVFAALLLVPWTVDADIGKLTKVEVSFTDRKDNPEAMTSLPFGPVVRDAPLPSPTTLVSNTGQTGSATAVIEKQYAQEFMLGDHGQGYELSSVSIDLAAVPTDLAVSLWIGDHSVTDSAPRIKLFNFENPASFQVGLNRFTAPAGVLAYQSVRYYIVLSDFGASLSINETTSNNEDAGGEPGAELANSAGGDTNVLRLAVKGSRRDGGISYVTLRDHAFIVTDGTVTGVYYTRPNNRGNAAGGFVQSRCRYSISRAMRAQEHAPTTSIPVIDATAMTFRIKAGFHLPT